MKLIDKDKVAAEIEKCYNESRKMAQVVVSDYWNGKSAAYRCILTLLDTLDVKEVDVELKDADLEKEIQSWIEDNSVNGYYREDICETAEHFFELGIKAAQKGE